MSSSSYLLRSEFISEFCFITKSNSEFHRQFQVSVIKVKGDAILYVIVCNFNFNCIETRLGLQ